ncbi:hypothetical protein JNB88_27370 [Rhizobium cauense]|nr:hypothetical protein [Rhizobium cauense]MBW9117344.1 hypothetical protein [Rhizobium cauense]
MDQGKSDKPFVIWVGVLVVVGLAIAVGSLTASYFDPPTNRLIQASKAP